MYLEAFDHRREGHDGQLWFGKKYPYFWAGRKRHHEPIDVGETRVCGPLMSDGSSVVQEWESARKA